MHSKQLSNAISLVQVMVLFSNLVCIVIAEPPLSQFLESNLTEYYHENKDAQVETPAKVSLHRCGGVLRAVNVTIHYKPFEKILPNERCVWIIASTNGSHVADSYRFAVNSMGFSTNDRLLSMAVIKKNTEAFQQFYLSSQNQVEGRVLVVTFHTKNITREMNGFVLTITSSQFSTGVDPSSRYEILDPDNYFHSHPPTSGAYLNNELTVLVFPPISQGLQGFRNQVIGCKERGLEEFFADWIGIHFFDLQSGTWIYKGRITGGFELEKIMHNDIILLVFDTNQNYAYLGFELTSLTT